MNEDKRTVVLKHERRIVLKSLLIMLFFIFLLLAAEYFFDSSDDFMIYLIIIVPFILYIILMAIIACGEEYVADEHGMTRKIFGKEAFAIRWSECAFIGTFYHANDGGDHFLEFACAKTPLRRKSIAKAKRYMKKKNARLSSRRKKLEFSRDDVFPAWKRKEAIMLDYAFIGDENYAKILELCGGEHIARETYYE